MIGTARIVALVALWAAALASPRAEALNADAAGNEAAQRTVRLCYNEQLGPPDGEHFSLQLIRALAAVTPTARFELRALPWMRCLVLVSRGDMDAILGASFTPERGMDLVYPRDARGRPDESLRLFVQGYRLLRRRGDALDFDGERFRRLVGPIGVERGHSSAVLARERGAAVDDSHPDVHSMLAKLRGGRVGGILVAEPRYATLRREPGLLDGVEAVPTALARRPYFLVFSRAFSQREPHLMGALWRDAARLRETPAIRQATAEQQGMIVEGEGS